MRVSINKILSSREGKRYSGYTNSVFQDFTAVVTNGLKNLLNLFYEAGVEDRLSQFDVAKMTGTFGHVLLTCRALELTVNRAETGIVKTSCARSGSRLVHGLGVEDVSNTHILDLFGREETELNLLHRLERRIGMRKVKIRHVC